MLSKLLSLAALAMLLMAGHASAAEYEIVNHPDIVFAEHDGTKLVGDLYLPKGRAKAHRETDHFNKYAAATKDMVAKREARGFSSFAMNMKAM